MIQNDSVEHVSYQKLNRFFEEVTVSTAFRSSSNNFYTFIITLDCRGFNDHRRDDVVAVDLSVVAVAC